MPNSTVHNSALPYSPVLHNTVLHNTVLHNTMQYNVAQLLKEQTGAVRRYELREDISLLDPELEFLGQLLGTLQLLRTNSGILVTGDFTTAVRSNCNRCLEPIAMAVRFSLEESFHPKTEVHTGRPLRQAEFEGTKDEWEDASLTIDEHHILDLAEVMRQNIWLAMPMYPACNWTGGGECPNLTAHLQSLEGVRLVNDKLVADKKEAAPVAVVDPRWASLLKLNEENETLN